MYPVTGAMLNARREQDCIRYTHERKYYRLKDSFVKRSLRPSEWQYNPFDGTLSIPRFGNERLLNEGAALRFIAENTNIPVPKLYGCFEDDNAVYLVTELIEGVEMADLEPVQRKLVELELEGYVDVLRGLKSSVWGGPSGIVIPPYRIMVESHRQIWKMKPRESSDLVFCHNDFSAHNVIVDPVSLKVKAIIDWEYAGFYPQEFESQFFRRPGPSVALDGERNDVEELLEIMHQNEE
ncbi:Protein kinase-like domain protein, partial [Metarhizium majus ARSEF 297]